MKPILPPAIFRWGIVTGNIESNLSDPDFKTKHCRSNWEAEPFRVCKKCVSMSKFQEKIFENETFKVFRNHQKTTTPKMVIPYETS